MPCIGCAVPEEDDWNMGGVAPEPEPNRLSGGDWSAAGPGKRGIWPCGSGGLVALPTLAPEAPVADVPLRRDVLVLLRFLVPDLLVAPRDVGAPAAVLWIGRWWKLVGRTPSKAAVPDAAPAAPSTPASSRSIVARFVPRWERSSSSARRSASRRSTRPCSSSHWRIAEPQMSCGG